jgi:RNA polymerase sigma-70 factor (ECF subfamily)
MTELEKSMDQQEGTRDDLMIELMDEYGDMVKKLAFTYVKDMSLAEDIAQDVFISCYHHLHRFEKKASYKTWIYRITVNRSKDVLKSSYFKKWLTYKPERNLDGGEFTPELKLIRKDDQSLVTNSLLQIPQKYRGILFMYYYDDLKIREISEVTKLKEATIKPG